MSVIGSNILAGASGQGGGYNLTRSLRFRSSASASLARTYSNTRTSGTTITYSTWIKRGVLGSGNQTLFFGYDGSSAATSALAFSQDGYNDQITFQFGGSSGTLLVTSPVHRDPSAWYHIVLAIDTTQATNTNRVKIYVNNVQVTSFANTFYPSQNATHQFLLSNANNGIGYRKTDNAAYFDGYMAETHCIDGQALTPSSFGETSPSTGVWQPKKYAGTYGTNGFYLPFTDNSALTTSSNVGLGKDFSGNGNYWTTNNISITAGSTYDSMTDVPTLTSATVANYCVLNPIRPNTATISNANLNIVMNNTATKVLGTVGMTSGKFYWECQFTSLTAGGRVGIATADSTTTTHVGQDANSWGYQDDDGTKANNNTNTAYGASYTTSDVIGVAFDGDNGTLTFYKNNTSQGTAFTGLTATPYFPAFSDNASASSSSLFVNFGQRPFAYTPPTGFVALNTFNLPTPTIGATASTQANKYFDATTFTSNNTSDVTVVNAGGFAPDLVWYKDRAAGSTWHTLVDRVRGNSLTLSSNQTDQEYNVLDNGYTGRKLVLNSNGFTINDAYNAPNTDAMIGWQWKANGTGVTNTAGSITSTVSANTSSGFSIVTYTGNAVASTVGHGLGVAPSMIIVKNRSPVESWRVYQSTLGGTKYLNLNTTSAFGADSSVWNNTNPTSTVFSIANDSAVNGSGQTHVAYCFSEVAGYSKFTSYTGNGSNDGVFVYTGFLPKYVMIKRTDASGYHWGIWDGSQNAYNVEQLSLYADTSDAQINASDLSLDAVSNGFKIRGNSLGINTSGGNYIVMAFASVPTKFSLAR